MRQGKKKGNRGNWRWPEKGTKLDLGNISSPYTAQRPPMCYPGTPLPESVREIAAGLLIKHINAIGSHTHGRDGEGGFESVQAIEARAIRMIASVLGIDSPDQVDGYFCGGGTEANIEGLWIGREYLRKCQDPVGRGTVVFATPLVHYSIAKAVEMLDIGHHQWGQCVRCGKSHIFMPGVMGRGLNLVGLSSKGDANGISGGMTNGEMSITSLKKMFWRKYDEGFRRFLIVATVGTCVMGSIDPIRGIGDFIREMEKTTGAHFYLHVDASFAGFTVPFVAPEYETAFQVPEVMSIAVDGDKMGRLPYPGGVFLCRKGLMSFVARKVNYVRGNEDDTISGSRSCLAPVLALHQFTNGGIEEQREYVRRCLKMRDKFIDLVSKKNFSWVRILASSPWVNFAPMIIDIEDGGIPAYLLENHSAAEGREPEDEMEGFLEDYHLRSDSVPNDPEDPNSCCSSVFKFCIMPHHTEDHLARFVADLERAFNYWKERNVE